jgi:hypothetical protein
LAKEELKDKSFEHPTLQLVNTTITIRHQIFTPTSKHAPKITNFEITDESTPNTTTNSQSLHHPQLFDILGLN